MDAFTGETYHKDEVEDEQNVLDARHATFDHDAA